jgi:hypothetical protein
VISVIKSGDVHIAGEGFTIGFDNWHLPSGNVYVVFSHRCQLQHWSDRHIRTIQTVRATRAIGIDADRQALGVGQ